ncbi:unknown protein [Parachlamydia acanthamoebae UV-7]|uniref:Uncharacterized protein n=2 Tax=Parachlamydia acanthamoebae TaxID=83552 RepID=F8L1G3_PARAV|nr:hypothetical protein DB43_GS00330 [Parachlamydia acanthamoebae]CCB87105.1 unknown protein [Parachlamydia acanthamoebae UV-7]
MDYTSFFDSYRLCSHPSIIFPLKDDISFKTESDFIILADTRLNKAIALLYPCQNWEIMAPFELNPHMPEKGVNRKNISL